MMNTRRSGALSTNRVLAMRVGRYNFTTAIIMITIMIMIITIIQTMIRCLG